MGAVPETVSRLPKARNGMPVPFVASWSSEHWHAIACDPVVGRVALFTAGRLGRGRPLFGVVNEPRQRQCVVKGLCGVCGWALNGPGWLPMFDRLFEAQATVGGRRADVTSEPPCCRPCATWSATGCPGIRGSVNGLARIDEQTEMLQLVDPSAAPARHERRFDREDERDRLGKIARRYGGVVGVVKVAVLSATLHELEAR